MRPSMIQLGSLKVGSFGALVAILANQRIGGHYVAGVELPAGIDPLTLGRKRYRADRRQVIMTGKGILHRSFAARSPGPAVYRLQQEARFIEKHDGSLLLSSLFLMRGQVRFRHRWMATSSRSMARRCGFCCVNPSACKLRPTWSGWYSTPHRWRMTLATRLHVHRLVRKPAANGPARTIVASSCLCAGESFGDRPRLGLAARTVRPPVATAHFQRLTLDKSA